MDELTTPTFFNAHGYAILRNAVDRELAAAIKRSLQEIHPDRHLIGMSRRHLVAADAAHVTDPKFRYKDLYVNHALVRQAVFSAAALQFLVALEQAPVLAFQNLGFVRGSGLRIHRDSNYVDIQGLDAHFYGCWIALEDVAEGAGELVFYPGSHLLPAYRFAEDSTRWIVSRDGIYANQACHDWLENQMASHGIAPEKFLARTGDCIIWHGDLVHAGAPVMKPGSTRYSLVTHFCNAHSHPRYLQNVNDRPLVRVNDKSFLCSAHYDLTGIDSADALAVTVAQPLMMTAPDGS